MWSLNDLKTPDTEASGKLFFSMKLQEEYDCKVVQYREIVVSFYSENMGMGEVVFSFSNPIWKPVPPKSVTTTKF